jgi:hypothetical protein
MHILLLFLIKKMLPNIKSSSTGNKPSKSPKKQGKVINKKGTLRRVVHRATFGDSESEVFCCRYDPSDQYIAGAFGDGVIRIYST